MHLSLKGVKNTEARAAIKTAAKFYASELLSPQLCSNISLEIIVKKDLDAYGYCCHLDTEGKARNFEIELKEDKCVNDLLSSLAHEMVHLKQYATGHLKDIANSPKIKWGKRVYESIVPETLKSYYATPWEKEAYAKEKKLFGKFKQAFPHFKNIKL